MKINPINYTGGVGPAVQVIQAALDAADAERSREVVAAFKVAFTTAFPEAEADEDTLAAIAGIAEALVSANETIDGLDGVTDRQAEIIRAHAVVTKGVAVMGNCGLEAAAGEDARIDAEDARLQAWITEAERTRKGLVEAQAILNSSGAYIDLVYQARLVIKNALDRSGDAI